jgi:tRNA pseudouridine38-40 synthase
MVRNLVGTFVDVGRGHIDASSIPEILSARNRSVAGPTAPAQGLFLVSVAYDKYDKATDLQTETACPQPEALS